MTALKVGIASYAEMKARSMAVARGERRVAADESKVCSERGRITPKVMHECAALTFPLRLSRKAG